MNPQCDKVHFLKKIEISLYRWCTTILDAYYANLDTITLEDLMSLMDQS